VALALHESGGGYVFAYRPEARYPWFVDCRTGRPFRPVSPDEVASKIAPPDFPYLAGSRNQEWWAQQASWGLCQVMGAVAREQGFRGKYLGALYDPLTNLIYGAKVLAGHLAWAHGDERVALGAYNAGRGNANGAKGQEYAATVLDQLRGLA